MGACTSTQDTGSEKKFSDVRAAQDDGEKGEERNRNGNSRSSRGEGGKREQKKGQERGKDEKDGKFQAKTKDRVVKINKGNVFSKYEKKRVLGEGGSCVVVIGTRKQAQASATNASDDFAIKCIDKRVHGQRDLWLEEITILQAVHHPYIVYLVEAYESRHHCAMVLEMMRGPELFEAAADPKFKFSEQLAAKHFKTMITAVGHLHSLNVVHGDLKPENFVFTRASYDSELKLIDFGCAVQTKPKVRQPVIGVTHYYASPELLLRLNDGLSREELKASDCWAMGCIMYILLTGQRPFAGRDHNEVKKSVLMADLRFSRKANLSRRVKDLIHGLLVKEHVDRLTCEQALRHQWVTDPKNNSDKPLNKAVLDTLLNLRRAGMLKSAVSRMLADNMSKEETGRMNALFNNADKDRSGSLDLKEVEVFMQNLALRSPQKLGRGYSSRRLSSLARDVMDGVDDDGDQMVSPEEFHRMLQLAMLASDHHLIQRAFTLLDKDQSQSVSCDELIEAFKIYFPEDEGERFAREMVREADTDGDGEISWPEFLQAMQAGLDAGSKPEVDVDDAVFVPERDGGSSIAVLAENATTEI